MRSRTRRRTNRVSRGCGGAACELCREMARCACGRGTARIRPQSDPARPPVFARKRPRAPSTLLMANCIHPALAPHSKAIAMMRLDDEGAARSILPRSITEGALCDLHALVMEGHTERLNASQRAVVLQAKALSPDFARAAGCEVQLINMDAMCGPSLRLECDPSQPPGTRAARSLVRPIRGRRRWRSRSRVRARACRRKPARVPRPSKCGHRSSVNPRAGVRRRRRRR
jgi:hypothetical protein